MPRRRKPNNETQEEAKIRRDLEGIANNASRSEKTSWNRKMNNMVTLIAKLRPLEDKILQLEAKKIPILDEVLELREIMVRECVHPFEELTHNGDHALCHFCGKKVSFPLDPNAKT